MNTTEINTHMAILVQIIRSIQLKKVLSDLDPNPNLNFWRVIHGNLLDSAVIEWSKVFGVNSQDTHWKLIVGSKEEDQIKFKEEMFESIGITSEQWVANWEHFKVYRNELAAHHVTESEVDTYPSLDIALESSYFYYSYLDGLIENDGADSIEAYSQRFYNQSEMMACQAIASTRIFNEKVF